MFGALLYLRLTSFANSLLFQLRRLRQPRYLLGTAVAVLYFYYFLGRRFGPAAGVVGPHADAQAIGRVILGTICGVGSLIALVRIAFCWISPRETPGLRFSEAEIAFLFPAPLSRRTLIHFRLLSSQLAILFTSFILMFVFRRFAGTTGSRIYQTFGWWVILSVFEMHVNGTELTIARMRELGWRDRLWRALALAAIIGYVVVVVRLAGAALLSAVAPHRDSLDAVGATLTTGALGWLTLPFRAVFGPYFAQDLPGFARAMGPALAVMVLHYLWVSRSQVSFEEGSIALAQRRTAMLEAARRSESPLSSARKTRAVAGPFPLAPSGVPEVAFLWKNLLSMRASLLNRRMILIGLWLLIMTGSVASSSLQASARAGHGIYGPLVAVGSAVLAVYTLLAGPAQARQDLRSDLPQLDMLRTYPVPGWRIALGELLAPTFILSLVLWVCTVGFCASVDSSRSIAWLTPSVRLTGGACLAVAAPLLALLQLIIPNLLMVMLPGWYSTAQNRTPGIEMMGQRLILGIGQLVIAAFVALPAVLAAGLVIVASQWILGLVAALVLALCAVVVILVTEAVLGLWVIGTRLEAIDLSEEHR
jgi:ABC-2 type transport system permease protein